MSEKRSPAFLNANRGVRSSLFCSSHSVSEDSCFTLAIDVPFLEVTMQTDEKLSLIREYLSVAFPDHPINYHWDSSRECHHFRVDTPDGHVKHNILLSRELVDDTPPDLTSLISESMISGVILKRPGRGKFW